MTDAKNGKSSAMALRSNGRIWMSILNWKDYSQDGKVEKANCGECSLTMATTLDQAVGDRFGLDSERLRQ